MKGLGKRVVRTIDLMSVLSDDEPPVRPKLKQIEPEEEVVVAGEAGFTDLVITVFGRRLLRDEACAIDGGLWGLYTVSKGAGYEMAVAAFELERGFTVLIGAGVLHLLDEEAQEGAGARVGVCFFYTGLAMAADKNIASVKTEDNIEEADGGE
jgi:hypothetical protein